MLLSLLKILFFFAVVMALALGATKLSETGQMLRIEFAGTEVALSPLKALLALMVLMVAAWLIFKLLGLILAVLGFLVGDETAINRHFARSRQRKGYEAFGEGMLAVASGEGKLAQDKAARAAKYMNMPHLTNCWRLRPPRRRATGRVPSTSIAACWTTTARGSSASAA